MPHDHHSSNSRIPEWLRSRWLRHWLLWSLAHFCALVLLENFLFLLSHIPRVPLDAVILLLADLSGLLRLPGRLLRHAWPSESTPTALLWGLAVLNSLVWGGLLMVIRRVWTNKAHRAA